MPQGQNLSPTAFEALPDNIKSWVSSPQATYLIMEINKRLGFKGEKATVIPKIIFTLVTKTTAPSDFISVLGQELEIDFPTAKAIAEDIEKKVLRPIENDLRKEAGVDVKLIYFGKPGTQAAIPLETARPIGPSGAPARAVSLTGPTAWERLRAKTIIEADQPFDYAQGKRGSTLITQPKPEKEPVVDLESFQLRETGKHGSKPISPIGPIGRAAPAPPAAPTMPRPEGAKSSPESGAAPKPKTQKTVEEEVPAAPFLLHQESQPEMVSQPTTRASPQINIRVQNYSQSLEADQRGFTRGSTQKPVAVKLETPQDADLRGQERGPTRTIPTPSGRDSNHNVEANNTKMRVVHYSGFRTPISANGFPKEPPAENLVDLRKFAKPDPNAVDLRKKS